MWGSANNNLPPVAKAMSLLSLIVLIGFWCLYLTIAAVFITPVPEKALNAVWFLAWAMAFLLLIVSASVSTTISNAEKSIGGKSSFEYAHAVTKEPLPPRIVSIITAVLLFVIAMSAAAAGFWFLATLYFIVNLISISNTVRRREYDAAARTMRHYVGQ